MHICHRKNVVKFIFAALLICISPTSAKSNVIVMYDPSLGTLPQAQGFSSFEVDGLSPAPSVSGGILYQGPTNFTGEQWFQRNDIPFNFDDGFTLEATLKIISSTYEPNAGGPGSQRSGFYLDAIDELGRIFITGISSGGVTVNTDHYLSTANGITFRSFNTTDAFHQYRLVVADGVATLLIDNTTYGSTPIGSALYPSVANRVDFGDETGGGNSQTQLTSFKYTYPVPEPGKFLLFASGLVLLFFLRKESSFTYFDTVPLNETKQ